MCTSHCSNVGSRIRVRRTRSTNAPEGGSESVSRYSEAPPITKALCIGVSSRSECVSLSRVESKFECKKTGALGMGASDGILPCFALIGATSNVEFVKHAQFVLSVTADDDVDALWEGPELLRDALPCVPPHEDRVDAPLRCVRGDTGKILHFFRQSPREASVLSNAVVECCGNDDCQSCHGGRDKGADRPQQDSRQTTWVG